MKILLVSDKESPYYWDYYQPGRLSDIDLILACGDLKSQYLSFLVTMGRARVLYVHGNHDQTYDRRPPEGCDCIEDKLVTVGGLRILGLGGTPVYSGGPGSSSGGRAAWTSSSPTPPPRATGTGRITPTADSNAWCPSWTNISQNTWSTGTCT